MLFSGAMCRTLHGILCQLNFVTHTQYATSMLLRRHFAGWAFWLRTKSPVLDRPTLLFDCSCELALITCPAAFLGYLYLGVGLICLGSMIVVSS